MAELDERIIVTEETPSAVVDDTVRIIQAKPEDVSDQDLEALVKNLIEYTFLPDTEAVESVRDGVRDAIDPLGLNYTVEEHIAGSIRTIKKAFDKGIVLVVKDGEKTVGIVGALSKKKMPDGRDIYELTKGSVLPEYRGRRLLSNLVEEGIRMVRESHPDSPLTTATKNPKALSLYRRLGWKEIDWDDGSEIDRLLNGGKPDGSDPRWAKEYDKMKAAGYKTFFFDPRADK